MAAALKPVSALLVLCVLVSAAPIIHALTCGQVTSTLGPCISYLRTGGRSPPVPCCNGVRALNVAARTTPDRQTACRCLQNAARQISGIKPNVAASLPGACGVNIPYKISTSTDCAKVK